jgi:glycosyltransferase involved in cell wall biosynthesis
MTTPAVATPTVSVVVPVHNGATTVGEQIEALVGQTYPGSYEVVVVDNNSTDETPSIVRAWSERAPVVRMVAATERSGAAYARNAGAKAARGDILAFSDADDVADSKWLEHLVAAIEDADVVGGSIESERLNDALLLRWRPPLPSGSSPISHGFLPYALGANVAFRRAVFDALGGFREDYPVGEDVELVWRAQLTGRRFAFSPDAVVHYRYRTGVAALVRQYVAYGTIGPRLYRDFRDAGMPGSPLRAAIGPWIRLLVRLPLALISRHVRGDVLRRIAFRVGRVRGSLAARVVYL